jgi:putative replication protein
MSKLDTQGSLAQVLQDVVARVKTPLPDWAFCDRCGYPRMATDGVRDLCVNQVGENRIGEVPYCRCADDEQNNTRLRFLHAGIPASRDPKTLQNFLVRPGTAEAYLAAEAFVRSTTTPPVLVLSSHTPGTGKSHLAEAITRETLMSGKTARYELVADLLQKLRPPDDGAVDIRDGVMNACTNAYLLWLDDAFMGNPTEWTAEQLFRLIDERIRNHRRIILTTNRSPDTMPKIYYRITDRLMDTQTGTSRWVSIDATSYRTNGE